MVCCSKFCTVVEAVPAILLFLVLGVPALALFLFLGVLFPAAIPVLLLDAVGFPFLFLGVELVTTGAAGGGGGGLSPLLVPPNFGLLLGELGLGLAVGMSLITGPEFTGKLTN